jgi:putative ABC transport system permease protein
LILGLDPKVSGQVDKTPVEGSSLSSALAAVENGGVLVEPTYARTTGLHKGSPLRLVGPVGTRTLRVAGELDGVGEFEGPEIRISLASMKAIYGPGAAAQLLVKARDGQAPALERRLAALVDRRYPNLEVQSAAAHKQQINDEVNKQFNFFNAIVAMAVIVSLLGVINTLAMSVIERTREIGVMRALGSSRWQVRKTMLDESLLITLAGAISGAAAGLLIGWVWVGSIGDLMPGMQFHLPVGAMTVIAIAAVIAGVIAAILPARRAARLKVIEALTYE